ncbi:unnamed protein product [Tuber melanosporum]|uniref:(Perigord truffle) hypothetical protein n=1 Tax=Tuber melanosporum (strain Mel28) TaxID=656061 RepID=D5G5W1_TUBMM|nr:uncharacterized protein GSTUM_00001598001 [Tuber melanosporum]CAZ79904.1 unnamed protein product [Tuber melanosporum]
MQVTPVSHSHNSPPTMKIEETFSGPTRLNLIVSLVQQPPLNK